MHEFVMPEAYESFEFRRLSRQVFSRTVPGALALALSAAAGAWIIHALPIGRTAPVAVSKVAEASGSASTKAAVSPYGALFDPGFFSGSAHFAPVPRAAEANLQPAPPAVATAPSAPQIALPAPPKQAASLDFESAPLPPPRPAIAAPSAPPAGAPPVSAAAAPRRVAQQGARGAPAAAPPPDNRNFFEKLFGAPQRSGTTLSYASAEGGLSSIARSDASGPSARYDRWTAVYDLAAHTVYLPDGTRLEAHSGLGDRLDDPNHVSERNRGATPPHVYALEPREQLFHGVPALRLNPIGGGDIFGRAGLLAHSYMLGPNGDSNGCVSFKDYEAFLRAYQNGQVKRLAVVARLD